LRPVAGSVPRSREEFLPLLPYQETEQLLRFRAEAGIPRTGISQSQVPKFSSVLASKEVMFLLPLLGPLEDPFWYCR